MLPRKTPVTPVIAVAVVVLGLAVIVGWWTHDLPLIRVRPGYVGMAYNTALGFFLVGSSLLCLALRWNRLAKISGCLAAAIGLVSLTEYAFSIDLRIDQIFMHEYIRAGIDNPARMAISTAFCLSSSSLALMIQASKVAPRHKATIVVAVGSVVAAMGTIAFCGYFTGVTAFYTWGKFTLMAVHTALGFMALSAGILSLEWTSWRRINRSLSLIAAMVGMTATVCLWQALTVAEQSQRDWMLHAAAATPPPSNLLDLQMHLPQMALIVGLGLTLLLCMSMRFSRDLQDNTIALLAQKMELQRANKELEGLARTDGLTGLANHRSLQERIAQEYANFRRSGAPLSVIMLDVDYFKLYNDKFGHLAGDDVLRRMGSLLRQTSRTGDFIARYGGEEFSIVVPLGAEDAIHAAERIRRAIESSEWPLRPITVSCGVCTCSEMTESADSVLERADSALYISKNRGRNRVTHVDDRLLVRQ